MYIETVNDLSEYLADLIGVYGGCKHITNVENTCPEESITCCRIGFVTNINERIRNAVENEKLLSINNEYDNKRNEIISIPTTKEIRKAREKYNNQAYCGHFAGDEPWKHFHAGIEWMLSRIKNK